MAVWFVRTDGSNGQDGRDALGLALANATYDHTGNGEGERHLSLTAAFAGYSFTSGDQIYLANAVGGVADGLYTIASRVDDDAVLLVADAGLTADSTTDVDSSDGPFATISYAINEAAGGNGSFANGDEVRICADASHTSANTISFDTTGGIGASPLFITGATANGLVDGTRATVDFGTTESTEDGFYQDEALGAASFVDWQHLRITGAARHNVMMNEPSSLWRFYDCRIDNAGTSGIYNNVSGGTSHSHALYLCEIDSNGGAGIGTSHINRMGPSMFACSVHDNTGDGVEFGASSFMANGVGIANCEIYDNGGHGIDIKNIGLSTSATLHIVNCTIDGNDGNGIQFAVANTVGRVVLVNTAVTNNGGFGLDLNAEGAGYFGLINCWFYNNTSGDFSDSLTASDFWPSANVTTGTDPEYTSRTDGSEDFTPDPDSPLLAAGIDASDVT